MCKYLNPYDIPEIKLVKRDRLDNLPMNDDHKKHVRRHWHALQADFRI